ncbi:Protein of unknown function [Bacillus mycoides]|uniref:Uncharacterized protein n=1 Tax=Bacillus mycoides TaxID=1405 RepID=A0A1C4EI84_BACMY|nr:Protein of unknown function [Bacillus mycoides]SCB78629.1 Protein of unknown function [Bacillus mycoides]SCC41972.1 Protein of unknown function [Bacillus mycoides]SCC43346.1 Protein of unknown function [Bacillus mycoides]
MVIVVFVMN